MQQGRSLLQTSSRIGPSPQKPEPSIRLPARYQGCMVSEPLAAAYPLARQWAEDETGLLTLPATLPFTVEQAMNGDLEF
jgi:hypothetical protein